MFLSLKNPFFQFLSLEDAHPNLPCDVTTLLDEATIHTLIEIVLSLYGNGKWVPPL
jgi:hypothetical protein